jgi:hypothetical protein
MRETAALQEAVENATASEEIPEVVEDYSFINSINGVSVTTQTNDWLIENLIKLGDIVTIKAEPGSGITWFLTSLALSAARQTVEAEEGKKTDGCEKLFHHFNSCSPLDITFCDGSENTERVLERIKAIKIKGQNIESKINLFCRDEEDFSFYIEENRDRLVRNFRSGIGHLVIFDSTSSLFGMDDDAPENVQRFKILNWIKELKNAKITQIFVTSGSAGLRLPSTIVDLALEVKRIDNPITTEMGVSFRKSKHLDSKDCIPFRLRLEKVGKGGETKGLVYYDDPSFFKNIVHDLTKDGMTQSQIAKQFGKNQSTISRWLSKSLLEGARRR